MQSSPGHHKGKRPKHKKIPHIRAKVHVFPSLTHPQVLNLVKKVKTFFLIIMWHKGKSVEQTAKICPDHFSPIATIQGIVLFFYMMNFDI